VTNTPGLMENMSMERLAAVDVEALDADQRRMYDVIVGTRGGGLVGPFSVLVRVPRIAEPANDLHNSFRLHGALERDVFELLVLMVARRHSADYAWQVHEAAARKAGLSADIIDAVRQEQEPEFRHASEKIVHDVTRALLDTKSIPDEVYNRAVGFFGSELVIEMVSAVGFYSMLCLILNSFRVSPVQT
jgi:4-carboxymuconolactone decarboxylase